MLLHIVRLCGWIGGESGCDLTRALGDQIGLQGVLPAAEWALNFENLWNGNGIVLPDCDTRLFGVCEKGG